MKRFAFLVLFASAVVFGFQNNAFAEFRRGWVCDEKSDYFKADPYKYSTLCVAQYAGQFAVKSQEDQAKIKALRAGILELKRQNAELQKENKALHSENLVQKGVLADKTLHGQELQSSLERTLAGRENLKRTSQVLLVAIILLIATLIYMLVSRTNRVVDLKIDAHLAAQKLGDSLAASEEVVSRVSKTMDWANETIGAQAVRIAELNSRAHIAKYKKLEFSVEDEAVKVRHAEGPIALELVLFCAVCNNSVKPKNMQKHLADVHPGVLPALRSDPH